MKILSLKWSQCVIDNDNNRNNNHNNKIRIECTETYRTYLQVHRWWNKETNSKGKKRENIDNNKDILYTKIRTDTMINNQNWKVEKTINQANKIGTNEEKY